ncbi:DUF1064 domain-containing protein [Sporosarcina sp. FSL W7-1349]|uniref:DUF1064 domain-containing protein n=1 Tax=Sporosarcina sp. FSL W7-1349 TaxID=2921561 RepID=UPI0030F5E065
MRQSVRKRPRSPKQPREFHSKKIEVDGIEFDSKTEAAYYKFLKKDPAVKDIEIQPKFQIIPSYTVVCKRCGGSGKRTSPKTGNLINCSLCHGKQEREKAGAIYTADFKVTYIDGYEEIIDVKGGPVTRDFPLRRKLLEKAIRQELVVVRLKGKEWVRE